MTLPIVTINSGTATPITSQQAQSNWVTLGGNTAAAQNMGQIAIAESSGVSDKVVIDTNGQPSVGLYQINGVNFQTLATTINPATGQPYLSSADPASAT